MADFTYGIDRIYGPVSVEEGAETIVIMDPDDGELVAEVTPRDRYYNHLDGTEDGVHGYALLAEIESAINDQATTEAYALLAQTPSSSSLTNSGLRIRRSGTEEFSLDFSSGDFTLDPRLLGFAADENTDQSSTTARVNSPFGLWGFWQSFTLADGIASDKRSRPYQNIRLSSDNVAQAARKRYLTKTFRRFRYEYVPGAHVRKARANDADSANTARLPQGDTHNAFEHVWNLITAADADDRLAQALIWHDEGDSGHDDVFTGGPWEVARLSEADQIRNLTDVVENVRMAGEYYKIEFDVDVMAGDYDQ